VAPPEFPAWRLIVSILQVSGLAKAYGGIRALEEVSFDIAGPGI